MKIVFVSSLQPETNYGRYLAVSLRKILGKNLIVYTDKNKDNRKLKQVQLVWKKGFSYLSDILDQIKIDKPDCVHLQQEMNMYGKPITTITFPFLLLLIRLLDIKVVVTVHAVIEKKIMDRKFVNCFLKNGRFIPIFLLKIYFDYLFFFIGLFSHKVIVHTKLLRKSLIHDYRVSSKKVIVIRQGVPRIHYQNNKITKYQNNDSNYFLYFGYISRRKGLENVVAGFSKFVEKYPKYKLILAGGIIGGQEFAQDELKKIIAKLKNNKQIIFTGFINQGQITRLFSHAKAVLLPAIVSISASSPQAQAYAYGKCIIASDIGNYREEIKDGETGFLIKNDQWENAFEKIVKNKILVKKIESNIKKIAIDRDWDRTAQKHLEIYGK